MARSARNQPRGDGKAVLLAQQELHALFLHPLLDGTVLYSHFGRKEDTSSFQLGRRVERLSVFKRHPLMTWEPRDSPFSKTHTDKSRWCFSASVFRRIAADNPAHPPYVSQREDKETPTMTTS